MGKIVNITDNQVITESDDLIEFTVESSCYDNGIIGSNNAKQLTATIYNDNNNAYNLENKELAVYAGIRKLPEGYRRVEYIESDATQYIDTGINADNNLRVVMDMAYTNISSPNNTNIGAIRRYGNSGSYSYTRYHWIIQNSKYRFQYGRSSNLIIINADTDRHVFDSDSPNHIAKIDNNEAVISYTNEWDCELNFWLFGRNSNISNLAYLSSVKLYDCKMYYSGTLVREFIPCINPDGEAGLYDLITANFYGKEAKPSTTANDFTAGSEVVDNEWVPFGNFIVSSIENDELSQKTTVTAFDYMIKFNKEFDDDIVYPKTAGEILAIICSRAGVELGSTTFTNSSFVVQLSPFSIASTVTLRNAVQEIAKLAGGFAIIGRDNKLYIKTLDVTEASLTIQEIENKKISELEEVKIKNLVGTEGTTIVENIDGNCYDSYSTQQQVGPINHFYYKSPSHYYEDAEFKNQAAIQEDGEKKYYAEGTVYGFGGQLEEIAQKIWVKHIKGFTYKPFQVEYYGFPYLDAGDRVNIADISDTQYSSFIFKHTFTFNGTFWGNISTEAMTENEQEYNNWGTLEETFRNSENVAEELIADFNKGYVIKYNGELYIADNERLQEATHLWRWNIYGLGYSETGINGPYKTAITMDGRIVADFIKSGTMSADRIEGGTLTIGGEENGNGVINIVDENGNIILTLTKDGIRSDNFILNKNGKATFNDVDITGGRIYIDDPNDPRNPTLIISQSQTESFTEMTGYDIKLISDTDPNSRWHNHLSSEEITLYDESAGYSAGTKITRTQVKAQTITQTSLEEQKKNFEKLENALEIINNIDIYKFNLNFENDNDKKHIGFVIGDKHKYSEDVTSLENNGVDLYSFVSVCCKGIQELQNTIADLKQEIQELKGEK